MDLVTEILPTSQGLDGLRIYGADCLVLARLFILILVVLPLCHSGDGHGVMSAMMGQAWGGEGCFRMMRM